jgi:hypothetical protein
MPPCCTTGRHSPIWTSHPFAKETHEKNLLVLFRRVPGADTRFGIGRMLSGADLRAAPNFNLSTGVATRLHGDDCSNRNHRAGRRDCPNCRNGIPGFGPGTARGVYDDGETAGCGGDPIGINTNRIAHRASYRSIGGNGDDYSIYNGIRHSNGNAGSQQDSLPDVSFF